MIQESKVATFFVQTSYSLVQEMGEKLCQPLVVVRRSACVFSVSMYLNISIYLIQYTIHHIIYTDISVSIHQYRVVDCTLPHEGKRVNQLVGKKDDSKHRSQKREMGHE